jgi:hypothetical protein
MAYHSAEFSVAGVNTANTSLLNLKATTTRSLSLMEFGVSYTVLSATAYDLGLVTYERRGHWRDNELPQVHLMLPIVLKHRQASWKRYGPQLGQQGLALGSDD